MGFQWGRDLSLPLSPLTAINSLPCAYLHVKGGGVGGADFLSLRPLRREGPGGQHDGIFRYLGSQHSGRAALGPSWAFCESPNPQDACCLQPSTPEVQRNQQKYPRIFLLVFREGRGLKPLLGRPAAHLKSLFLTKAQLCFLGTKGAVFT